MKKDVLCIGSALVDFTLWPADPERIVREHFQVESSDIGIGGCGGNASMGFASLGKTTSLLARLGSDVLSDLARGILSKGGVDLSHLAVDPVLEIGRTLVLVSQNGERRFLYKPGANAHLCQADCSGIQISQFSLIHSTDLFLLPEVQGKPLVSMLQEARKSGVLTSLDTVWDPSGRWFKTLEPLLPHLDYLFVSTEEAVHIFPGLDPQEQVSAFLERIPGTVVLKRGENGCLIGRGDQRFSVKPQFIKAKDTTGAGDAFTASFMCCVLEGMDLQRTARIATAFAGEVIQFLGATSGLKPYASVAAFAEERGL